MYGVPAHLPLDPFLGQALIQIALGQYEVQLHFSDVGSIAIEGAWELRDADGGLVDQAGEHAERDCYRIHRIIGLSVDAFTIDAPRSFCLLFERGYRLTVFDDTPQYEAFAVHLDGKPSVYV